MGSELIPSGSDLPPDFQALLAQLGEVFRLGQQQIEEIKVRSYWEAGQLMHRHILKHEKRAEELYLNNFLLAEGYARRMDKVALADWEEGNP
jgi:hypothetical protein